MSKPDRAITLHLEGGHTQTVNGTQKRWDDLMTALRGPARDWVSFEGTDGTLMVRVGAITAVISVPYAVE